MISFSSLFGMALFLGVMVVSIVFTTTNYLIYLNLIGISIVLGGTIASAFLAFRGRHLIHIFFSISKILHRDEESFAVAIAQLLKLAMVYEEQPNYAETMLAGELEGHFLRDGIELLVEGFNANDIREILEQSIEQQRERETADSEMIESIAKWPPAFGMVGTLIGLIALMQDMGGSENFSNLGPSMAVALVTTLYGLIISFGVLAPIAEHLLYRTTTKMRYNAMVVDALVAIKSGHHPLKIQKKLNAFLAPRQRKDWLKNEVSSL